MEARDSGKWTCLVSVVNGSEVTTAEGHAQVLLDDVVEKLK